MSRALNRKIKLKQTEESQDSKLSIANDNNESMQRRNDSVNKDRKTIEQDTNNNNNIRTTENQNRFQENQIMTVGNIYDPNHLNYLQNIIHNNYKYDSSKLKNIYSLSTKNVNNPKDLNNEETSNLNNLKAKDNFQNQSINMNAALNKFLSGTNLNLAGNGDKNMPNFNNINNTFRDPNAKETEVKHSENAEEMVSAINKFLENINTNNKTPQSIQQMDEQVMDKQLQELEKQIEFQKEENKRIYEEKTKKENESLEKIRTLESKLLNSDKKDYPQLIQEKKERENQVFILKNQIQNLSQKFSEESAQYKSLVGEMIKTLEEINTEIILIRYSKDQLIEYKQNDIPKNVQKNENKIELVMKYSKPSKPGAANALEKNNVTITRGNDSMMEENDIHEEYKYKIRKSGRENLFDKN